MLVTAIITAAGRGVRMGSSLPKQFLEISGRPVISWTVEKFSNSYLIDAIVVAVARDMMGRLEEVLRRWPAQKVRRIVVGGDSRQDSVYNAIRAIDWECGWIAVHDGVRPLVSTGEIEDVVQEAYRCGAAILAAPLNDTIKVVNGTRIERTIDRSVLWGAKTPQVFRKDILVSAYEKALKSGYVGTDDASLVEHLGIGVSVVHSRYGNIKITTPDDLIVAEALLKSGQE